MKMNLREIFESEVIRTKGKIGVLFETSNEHYIAWLESKVKIGFWKKLSDVKPNSYQTGSWDGKMSDEIFFVDEDGNYYVGKCYQGFMDGSEFCCFYDQNDYEVPNVYMWAEITTLW